MSSIFEKVFDYVKDTTCIDSHEHIFWVGFMNRGRETSAFDFMEFLLRGAYSWNDMNAAGLPLQDLKRIRDTSLSVKERWKIMEPYWELCRYTGYGKLMDLSVQALYGVDEINENTVEYLFERFAENSKPATYDTVYTPHILEDLCKIKTCIVDTSGTHGSREVDPKANPYYHYVFRVDPYMIVKTAPEVRHLGEVRGIRVNSLGDYEEVCRRMVSDAMEEGYVGLKFAMAYNGTLDFQNVNRDAAEQEFLKIMEEDLAKPANLKIFRDYLCRFVLTEADRRGLVVQFHTGTVSMSSEPHVRCRTILPNTDPMQMCQLFLDYPNVKFDLLHMGYPYHTQIVALAKTFPNVYVDMAWVHVVNPSESVKMLESLLESVPLNKVIGYGGDVLFVDCVYGTQYIARRNIAKALANKVEEGLFDMKTACRIADRLLFDNANELFQLNMTR